MLLTYPLIILFLIFNFFKSNEDYKINYNLKKPTEVIQLPEILNEISGLTDIDNNHIACTQDELGIIFIINLKTGGIKNQYKFEPVGDFEGLTHVNGSFYVLRSDGRITYIPDYKKPEDMVHIKENLPTKDNEGLCYDKLNHRLIIAAKSKPDKISSYNNENRLFYNFDLKNIKLDTTPAFILNVSDIVASAQKFNITLPVHNPVKPIKKVNFRPSSIAVHPVSQHIYIISAADFLLVVCDRKGNILQMDVLDPELFPKAEGITFLPDNTMIITNEAAGKTPTLLKFKYST